MSYTPPTGSAVDLTLGGPYTTPRGDMVYFAPADGLVINLYPVTSIGTPRAAMVAQASSLSASVSFGTPESSLKYTTTGIASLTIGTPTAAVVANVTGVQATAFGSPAAVVKASASSAPAPSIGTPVARQQSAASSISSTQIGYPSASVVSHAQGLQPFVAGQAKAIQRATASSTSTTSIGTPRAVMRGRASGIAAGSSFGLPAATVICRAAGFVTTRIGAPFPRFSQTDETRFTDSRCRWADNGLLIFSRKRVLDVA